MLHLPVRAAMSFLGLDSLPRAIGRRLRSGGRGRWRAASRLAIGAEVVGFAAMAGATGALVWRRRRGREAVAVIGETHDSTVLDRSGAVRSVQAADLVLPEVELAAIWTPMHLERLARTYWRFLSRVTVGVIRVAYTPTERFVVVIARPLVLLRFRAPEYEMDARRGIVRWRIESGLLVSQRGRGGDGYLQIDVQRGPPDADGLALAHVEVEVASFYPAIASRLGTRLYQATQSRIHVLVTRGFLRSLVRLDLAKSRVGRFAVGAPEAAASIDDVPDPPSLPEALVRPMGAARSADRDGARG